MLKMRSADPVFQGQNYFETLLTVPSPDGAVTFITTAPPGFGPVVAVIPAGTPTLCIIQPDPTIHLPANDISSYAIQSTFGDIGIIANWSLPTVYNISASLTQLRFTLSTGWGNRTTGVQFQLTWI